MIKNSEIVIFGGSNIDLTAKTISTPVIATSNPSFISIAAGGVGRNIAQFLSLLESPPYLCSSIGNDENGNFLKENFKKHSFPLQYIYENNEFPTGIYGSIVDEKGEMLIGFSDMRGTENIPENFIMEILHTLKTLKPTLIIIDFNLNITLLNIIIAFANENDIQIIAEPVSVSKSQKIKKLRGEITYIKPNLQEYESIRSFLHSGIVIKNYLITRGEMGVSHLNSDGKEILYKTIKIVPVNPNGAGDSFIAGFAHYLTRGESVSHSILLGISCSMITLGSLSTIPDEIDKEILLKYFYDLRRINNYE